jgi:hypothetical protein
MPNLNTHRRNGSVLKLQGWDEKPSPNLTATIKAPKNQVTVVLVLGTEPRDGSMPIDLESAMKELGWVRLAAASPPIQAPAVTVNVKPGAKFAAPPKAAAPAATQPAAAPTPTPSPTSPQKKPAAT